MYRFPKTTKIFFPITALLLSLFLIAVGYFVQVLYVETIGFYCFFFVISIMILDFQKYLALKTPDSHHPYGYTKYASMIQLLISIVFLGFVVLTIWKTLLEKTISDSYVFIQSHIQVLIGIILILNILLIQKIQNKSDMNVFSRKSTLMILSPFFMILIFLLIHVYPNLDFISSLILLLVLLKMSSGTIVRSIDELCDHCCIPEKHISELVKQVEEVNAVYNIRTYGTKYSIFVDLQVALDPDMQLIDAKPVLTNIKKILIQNYTSISDVTVHIRPYLKNSDVSI
ncbi:cation transporter dimerization domain-containing protein [Methanohalophilus sp.]|uniref:cation transporter dimerization domain-containing protein n=1 Tax=Methanohalophilus sp. TaxID=1966352 RepID=UPI0026072CD9|nr:cation transporter dimerization domain-containing protein [Methanohalophilus sp.]MDK2891815.1 hypothetical protein [Methanohalophilus sp.]